MPKDLINSKKKQLLNTLYFDSGCHQRLVFKKTVNKIL